MNYIKIMIVRNKNTWNFSSIYNNFFIIHDCFGPGFNQIPHMFASHFTITVDNLYN